jgi:hypothetical protein
MFKNYKSTDNSYIKPASNDPDEVWIQRQKYIDCTDYIAIKTIDSYVVIDVDIDTNNKHIQTVLSSGKKLPHIFIKDIGDCETKKLFDMELGNSDNSFNYTHKTGFGEGLYKHQWSWCKKDEVVVNSHNDIVEFDLTIFNKDILVKAIKEQKQLNKAQKQQQLSIKKKVINGDILDKDVELVLSCIDKECHYDDYFKLACFFHKHLDLEQFLKWLSIDNAKYIEDDTRKLWDSLKYEKDMINLGTLHYMAKSHNETKYEQLFSKTDRLMLSVVNDFKVAELIHHLYSSEFVFLNINKGSCWYHFKDHRWHIDENNLTLTRYMAKDIVDLFENKRKNYKNKKVQEFFYNFIQKIQMHKNQSTFVKESQILFNTWF